MTRELLPLREREGFIQTHRGFAGRFADLPPGVKADMAAADREYGEIICRCENVTKREDYGYDGREAPGFSECFRAPE